MLDEGVVSAAADIDLCMVLGAGWPFWLGGITPYLDRIRNRRVSPRQALPRLGHRTLLADPDQSLADRQFDPGHFGVPKVFPPCGHVTVVERHEQPTIRARESLHPCAGVSRCDDLQVVRRANCECGSPGPDRRRRQRHRRPPAPTVAHQPRANRAGSPRSVEVPVTTSTIAVEHPEVRHPVVTSA